jgi:hypothetical protein
VILSTALHCPKFSLLYQHPRIRAVQITKRLSSLASEPDSLTPSFSPPLSFLAFSLPLGAFRAFSLALGWVAGWARGCADCRGSLGRAGSSLGVGRGRRSLAGELRREERRELGREPRAPFGLLPPPPPLPLPLPLRLRLRVRLLLRVRLRIRLRVRERERLFRRPFLETQREKGQKGDEMEGERRRCEYASSKERRR